MVMVNFKYDVLVLPEKVVTEELGEQLKLTWLHEANEVL